MSQQSLIDAAKAPNIAYNNKDWEAVKAAVTPGFLYDEVATQRKIHQGTAVGTKKIDLVYFIKPNFYPCLHAS